MVRSRPEPTVSLRRGASIATGAAQARNAGGAAERIGAPSQVRKSRAAHTCRVNMGMVARLIVPISRMPKGMRPSDAGRPDRRPASESFLARGLGRKGCAGYQHRKPFTITAVPEQFRPG